MVSQWRFDTVQRTLSLFRYKLSLRDLSELLLDRGIEVSYEAIRNWIDVWGVVYAQAIRKRKGSTYRDKWHVDEIRVVIKRLIDADGQEIEILLQKHQNAKAAKRFLKKALKLVGKAPRVMITDKLRSYGKVHKTLMKSSEHRSHKRLNNLIEKSHQPTREKERQMRKFKSVPPLKSCYPLWALAITYSRLTVISIQPLPTNEN